MNQISANHLWLDYRSLRWLWSTTFPMQRFLVWTISKSTNSRKPRKQDQGVLGGGAVMESIDISAVVISLSLLKKDAYLKILNQKSPKLDRRKTYSKILFHEWQKQRNDGLIFAVNKQPDLWCSAQSLDQNNDFASGKLRWWPFRRDDSLQCNYGICRRCNLKFQCSRTLSRKSFASNQIHGWFSTGSCLASHAMKWSSSGHITSLIKQLILLPWAGPIGSFVKLPRTTFRKRTHGIPLVATEVTTKHIHWISKTS